MRQRLSTLLELISRISIRARLTALAGTAALVVLTVGSLLLYDGLHSAIDDAVTAELRIRVDDVAAELRAGEDPPLAGGLVTQVLTPDGHVVVPVGAEPIVDTAEISSADDETVIDRPVFGVGAPARVVIQRVRLSDGEERLVAAAGSTAPIVSARRRLAVVLGVAGPAMALAVAAAAWVLTSAALRPVSRMTRSAAVLSLGEADARLPQPPGRDEIAELGTTLNAMLDRIASTVAHERAFIDDASHELRTPLAVMRSELELARLEVGVEPDGPDAERTVAALDSALEEVERLAALATRLLVLARADAGGLVGPLEVVDLRAVIERAAAGVVDRTGSGSPVVEVDVELATVRADPGMLEQLLANLIDNAVRFANGTIRIGAAAADDGIRIEVADDGPGFAPDVIDRAFDRFSRSGSSPGRGGTGLGLAIAAAIATAHGGSIHVANDVPGGGARVTVVIPA